MNDLTQLKEKALERFIPLVREKTGDALKNECKVKMPENILEIGTAIGYSGILMLSSCSGKLCTLEKAEERFDEAKENFKNFNLQNRVEMLKGDALEFLKNFADKKRKFDFVFLDGPKGQYIHYYPYIKEILSLNGTLFADNVKLLGLVGHEEKVTHRNRTMTRNMEKFIDTLKGDKDFKSEFFDTEDGFVIAAKVR